MTNPDHDHASLFDPPVAYAPGVCEWCKTSAPVVATPDHDCTDLCEPCAVEWMCRMKSVGYGPHMIYPYRQY